MWEDELNKNGKPEDWIDELIIGGAKSYSYKTKSGNYVVKQKGVSLDFANAQKVNFQTLKNMVLDNAPIETYLRFPFKWSNTKDVITKYIPKTIKQTLNTKRILSSKETYETYPFGFKSIK